MNKSKDAVDQNNVVQVDEADHTAIPRLIGGMDCADVETCQKARLSLVSIGKPAVGPLIEALRSRKLWVRWEAAKALGQIADPVAAEALVGALRDKEFAVRWLAAEALIGLGRDALKPLLAELMKHADAQWLRQGAYLVLRTLAQRSLRATVQPVLDALDGVQPGIEVPLAARKVLDTLRKEEESEVK
ncbi:MAG: HEAT repeat domain-containing protein [Chloroflexi bacterium]|nr:HEAT repeat domain-containing protein [Chloroflexota bacterium]